MESKIIKENKNKSLNRTEYILEVEATQNPSKADIVSILKSDADATVVRKIEGSFGKDNFMVDALVYNSKEDKEKFETITRKARKKLADEAKKAAEEAAKQQA